MSYNNRQYTLIPIGKAVYCLFVFCLTPNGVNTCIERCECVRRSMHVLTPFGARAYTVRCTAYNILTLLYQNSYLTLLEYTFCTVLAV